MFGLFGNKKDQAFKGYETLGTEVQMSLNMHIKLAGSVLFLQIIIILFSLPLTIPSDDYYYINRYLYSSLLSNFSPETEVTYFDGVYTASSVADTTREFFYEFVEKGISLIKKSLVVWFLFPLLILFFKERAVHQVETLYIRGSRLLPPKEYMKFVKKLKEKTSLSVGTIHIHRIFKKFFPVGTLKMPVNSEPKHTLLIGVPGSGKTQVLSNFITELSDRNAKAVIHDYKGDLTERFYDPDRDLIFNVLDKRCLGWTIFNDLHTIPDIIGFAHSNIPTARQADAFWNEGGRSVLTSIFHFLKETGHTSNRDIWNAVSAPAEEIKRMLEKTEHGKSGLRYIEDASGKMALSVLAVLMQFVKPFEFLVDLEGDFSVKKWVESDKGGFIFVSNYAQVKDTLKPILSLFIDLMGRTLLSLKDDPNRRLFIILDEMNNLQKLPSVLDLLTGSRSKGGCVMVSIQDTGRTDQIYGPEGRRSIINSCGNNIIFSVADPDIKEYLSKKIDSEVVEKTEQSVGIGTSDMRDGINFSRREVERRIVLPSEIAGLPDLSCFVRFAGVSDPKTSGPLWTKTSLIYKNYPPKCEAFKIRDGLVLSEISSEHEIIKGAAGGLVDEMKKDLAEESRKKEKKKEKTTTKPVADKDLPEPEEKQEEIEFGPL